MTRVSIEIVKAVSVFYLFCVRANFQNLPARLHEKHTNTKWKQLLLLAYCTYTACITCIYLRPLFLHPWSMIVLCFGGCWDNSSQYCDCIQIIFCVCFLPTGTQNKEKHNFGLTRRQAIVTNSIDEKFKKIRQWTRSPCLWALGYDRFYIYWSKLKVSLVFV